MSLLALVAAALPVAAVPLAPVDSRQWECVAAAGNGRHSDAHEADAPARQLQRAAQLTADSYRFAGQPGAGGGSVGSGGHAPVLRARAAEIAEKPRSGVLLRGRRPRRRVGGPRARCAGPGREGEGRNRGKRGNAAVAGDSGGAGGAGWTGIAAAAGAGALVATAGGFLLVRRRGRGSRGRRGRCG
ncbi:hypothetical protein [Streptomyces sp. EN23]|uniref:hypothetical protein n=1 Tax=Streptomyces sp. EN23 TaxID=212774 RepID=UPI000AF5D266|nr:hypothetical protein [Streptomyces sp. EN23]